MKKRRPLSLLILLLFLLVFLVVVFMFFNKPKLSCIKQLPFVVNDKQINERRVWEGNRGYFVEDSEYVYFGKYKTISEDIPAR